MTHPRNNAVQVHVGARVLRAGPLLSAWMLVMACSAHAPRLDTHAEVLPGFDAGSADNASAKTSPTARATAGSADAATVASVASSNQGTNASSTGGSLPQFEVTEPQQCSQVDTGNGISLDGDLIIDGPPSQLVSSEITEVHGNLIVKQSELPINLSRLQLVTGDVRMDSGSAPAFSAPNLTRVDGDVWFYLNPTPVAEKAIALKSLDLRNLKSVGGRVFIHRNLELEALQLEALREIGASAEVSGNLRLPTCMVDRVAERFSNVTPQSNGSTACTCTRNCDVVTATCP